MFVCEMNFDRKILEKAKKEMWKEFVSKHLPHQQRCWNDGLEDSRTALRRCVKDGCSGYCDTKKRKIGRKSAENSQNDCRNPLMYRSLMYVFLIFFFNQKNRKNISEYN